MTPEAPWTHFVLSASGASAITGIEVIQSLWRGYGQIYRLRLKGGISPTLILKAISLPERPKRSAAEARSHHRKLLSYDVEISWYRNWSAGCDDSCRIPYHYGAYTQDAERWLLLEDLTQAGFSLRRSQLDQTGISQVLQWLAAFHCRFLGADPTGLWPIGSYWHLHTRPDEHQAMPAGALKQAAVAIDQALNTATFQTLVHGDAKLANICFNPAGRHQNTQAVALVDFQYVGRGCGIKDVVYFLDSCLSEDDCERYETELLELYFSALRSGLDRVSQITGQTMDTAALEAEWRRLYPLAWTDFQRFLLGWMPGQNHLHPYSQKQLKRSLSLLN